MTQTVRQQRRHAFNVVFISNATVSTAWVLSEPEKKNDSVVKRGVRIWQLLTTETVLIYFIFFSTFSFPHSLLFLLTLFLLHLLHVFVGVGSRALSHLWVAWWSPHRLLIELRLNCVSWTCFHGVLPWPHSERIVSGPVWFTSLCWSDVSVWSCWFSLQVFTSWHADNNIIFSSFWLISYFACF